MLAHHALVASELLRIAGRAAEHLTPPCGHVLPMLLADPAGEQLGEQVIGLDSVVEGVDQSLERLLASGPLVERRHRYLLASGV
jgi:hypothetical protein